MNIEDAIKKLEMHQMWRRGDSNIEYIVNPVELGIAIDVVIDFVKEVLAAVPCQTELERNGKTNRKAKKIL